MLRFYQFMWPCGRIDPGGRSLEFTPGVTAGLPGVECPVCGQIWARFGAHIHKELPPDHPLQGRSKWPVPPDELHALIEDVRRTLDLPADLPILPGTEFGPFRLRLRHAQIPDFEWPGRLSIVITQRVLDLLVEQGLTGWHTEPVVITNARPGRPDMAVYELVVDGRAGMAVFDPPLRVRSVCPACGRVEYEPFIFENFSVDEGQWDGSDFVRFDPPCDGYVLVTERVKATFEAAELQNSVLIPIEEVKDPNEELRQTLRRRQEALERASRRSVP